MQAADKAAGQRLRAFLETRMAAEAGWQEDLARRTGVSRTMMYRWLAGSEPTMESCRRLASAVGVKRWELVRALDGD